MKALSYASLPFLSTQDQEDNTMATHTYREWSIRRLWDRHIDAHYYVAEKDDLELQHSSLSQLHRLIDIQEGN